MKVTPSALHPAATPPANTWPTLNPTTKSTDPKTNTSLNETLPTSYNPIVTKGWNYYYYYYVTMKPTPPPAPIQCSYNVSTIKFGLQIDITSSTDGFYNITITEEAQPEKTVRFNHSNQTSSHDFKHLKPCTEYEHAVEFIHDDGTVTFCNHISNVTTVVTEEMNRGDIKDGRCVSEHVCYRSDWDIGSLMSASNNVKAKQCHNNSTVFCIKPGINDFCTTLNMTFTSTNCPNSSFSHSKVIPVESLDASDIKLKVLMELPAKIEATLPPNCENLPIDYTCLENGNANNPKNLSEVEPFTDYSCTGQINKNNVTITTTPAVNVYIDCDVTTKITPERVTNTSIHLSWTSTSLRCKDALYSNPKFDFDCSCVPPPKHGSGRTPSKRRGTCEIRDLKPDTDYKCEVQPVYDGMNVGSPDSRTIKTDIGTPEDIRSLSVTVQEHNVIKVTCEHSGIFNGPGEKYIAHLRHGGTTVKHVDDTKCKFEFRDLSYSTTYRLEVAAFNGKHTGKPERKEVDTLYNDKAVIGFLIFLIILTSVALLLVVYKIFILKCRQSHVGDMMLYENAIYMNVPRS
ncbi:receptor-type tyrosine-protein phosphatase C-like [Notolabrus celidotus]|uniref:receptor-type tyrosine-protein phosphatase C-like n=1 Tax=Notolabrus celidotus TaxID=1203425 RepID=UPI00148F77D5|nr:receptor-type tyrosine-protein phosphatase C-like [Notolabrus celidotus]